ncbi:glycosyl hydrolase family 28 protein [Lentisphaerota bacterium WC36G]|nr:right-handed parallel beta-helix repeat-containing protein [Lentisphaerae bacterium WC36]
MKKLVKDFFMMVTLLCCFFTVSMVEAKEYNVKNFGAVGDGVKIDSAAIQKAIDKCNADGGGTVVVPAGNYLSGTILFKDNVTMKLEKGAVILGSKNFKDYSNPDFFVDAVKQKRGWCLIGIVDVKNVKIIGEGTIDGQGKVFRNPRPFLVRVVRSENLEINGVKLQSAGAWCLHLYQSKNVQVKNIAINNLVNGNNDGIDIDSSENILIENCDIESGDDSVCIKATSPKPTRNVWVKNCRLSSHWGAFKMGTESMGDFINISFTDSVIHNNKGGAMKILSVDGARLENLYINNIKVIDSDMTLFMRLSNRLNKYREKESRKPGCIRGVKISNITSETSEKGRLVHPTGIIISGRNDDDLLIENVQLENIKINLVGDGKVANVAKIEEITKRKYPEYIYFTHKAPKGKNAFPAFGIYARHVKNIDFKNIEVIVKKEDERNFIHLENAHKITLDNVSTNNGNKDIIVKNDKKEIVID